MTEQQIFQLLGIAYVAIGLGAWFNPKYYRRIIDEYLHTPPLAYLNGALALFVGYLLAVYEFPEASGFAWIIKLIGWLGVIKGILIIVVPKQYLELLRSLRVQSIFVFEIFFVLVLGGIMLYLGFK